MANFDFGNDLVFIKKRRGFRSDADISVSAINCNGKKTRMSFTFRNDVQDILTKTGYIQFAFKKNRIFFKEANEQDGFKITHGKETSSYYLKTIVEDFEQFIGDYDLKYDEFYELYYIEKAVRNDGR